MIQLRHLILLISLGFSTSLIAKDLSQVIQQLNPRLGIMRTTQLAKLLIIYSTVNRTDPFLSLAIAMQESSLVPGRVRITNGLETDFGLFQIYLDTADNYSLDVQLLKTDLEYQVRTHVELLAEKQRLCKDLKREAWTCYHSRTEELRTVYRDLVSKYYKGKGRIKNAATQTPEKTQELAQQRETQLSQGTLRNTEVSK